MSFVSSWSYMTHQMAGLLEEITETVETGNSVTGEQFDKAKKLTREYETRTKAQARADVQKEQ